MFDDYTQFIFVRRKKDVAARRVACVLVFRVCVYVCDDDKVLQSARHIHRAAANARNNFIISHTQTKHALRAVHTKPGQINCFRKREAHTRSEAINMYKL